MKNLTHQKGVALLVFALLMITATATVTVKHLNTRTGNIQLARDKITASALAQAKDALIGYAITYGDTHTGKVHGYLPCPDQSGGNPEGSAEHTCGNKDMNRIGRLPWRNLDLTPLRGGNGECLWYAVSGTYKNSPPTGLMNWDTNGQFQVYAADGSTLLTPADNQAVAVIFAPGNALPGQNRTPTDDLTCGGNYTASKYLDNDSIHHINNADIDTGKFIKSHVDRDKKGNIILTVNDQLVFITKKDIWNAMKNRESTLLDKLDSMTRQTAKCIANFGKLNRINGIQDNTNKSLPWPASLTLSDYGKTDSYNDKKHLYAGRVPYQVDTSRNKTGNLISSDYLLTSTGENCPDPAGWAAIYPWWYNWKDHLFYALSQKSKPSANSTHACDNDHCLRVNSSSERYAAVVMFAGKVLTDQSRTYKNIVTNYLEKRNSTNYHDATGHENYQTGATNASFNDILYCIKNDLSVASCP